MRIPPFFLTERHLDGAVCLFPMLVVFALATTLSALAAPPANDTCAGAVVIPSNATFPYLTPILTNINEATLTNDPIPSPSCIVGAARGVWYQFTPPQTGTYSFSTGADTATTAFDTILGVFTAPNGCASMPVEYACNDDSGAANNLAGLSTNLTSGVNYFIVVWLSTADNENPLGALSLQIRVDRPLAPANDTCASAEVIPANLSFPRMSSMHETILASSESITPSPSCGTGYRSVWFKFTPATTETYILSTGIETATTVFDTMMVLYSTTSDCGAMTEVTCSDNGESRGSIFRTLNAGTTYYIAVLDEFDDPVVSETAVQLNVAKSTVPTVVTLPPISISSTGAVLSGMINPNGLQSRFWFEWGPTTTYDSSSTPRLLFPGVVTITSNTLVTGFSPGATYHYRMVATNILGRVNGLDQTFAYMTNRPTLGNPEQLPSGNFRFTFNANPNQLYSVQSSTNLVNWTTLGLASELPAGSGFFTYTHFGAGSSLKRFYRVNAP
ncbi:MAG TPA: hypothetical protein VJS65_12225 [Verrucomicrobiae bacterium]|nr:hypothetical protein [Verrucomicrobiae bacterium]